MRFVCSWGLGDHVCYTGLPAAYYKYYGEKLGVGSTSGSQYDDLWQNNPYCEVVPYDPAIGLQAGDYKLQIESYTSEDNRWFMYKPQRIFHEMTGRLVASREVNPKLYYAKQTVSRRAIICDETTWESKRGYRHFNELAASLQKDKWEIIVVHTPRLNHVYGEQHVFAANCMVSSWEPLEDMMHPNALVQTLQVKARVKALLSLMATAELYVGYDNGLAHIAGAMDIPYVLITGSVPPISVRHASCIYALEVCDHCCKGKCERRCLENAPNRNDEIMAVIKNRFPLPK